MGHGAQVYSEVAPEKTGTVVAIECCKGSEGQRAHASLRSSTYESNNYLRKVNHAVRSFPISPHSL